MKDVFLPVLKTTKLFIILYILDGVSCRRFLFTIALRSFEKKIYSKRLKLPVAVHSSSVEILICQNYPFQDLARVFPQQQKIAITNETNK